MPVGLRAMDGSDAVSYTHLVSLQITNGFANPFLSSFKGVPEYADTFGVNHANALISLSQVSETRCV